MLLVTKTSTAESITGSQSAQSVTMGRPPGIAGERRSNLLRGDGLGDGALESGRHRAHPRQRGPVEVAPAEGHRSQIAVAHEARDRKRSRYILAGTRTPLSASARPGCGCRP